LKIKTRKKGSRVSSTADEAQEVTFLALKYQFLKVLVLKTFTINFQITEQAESCVDWFQFSPHFLLQTIRDCGQEEVHAAILHRNGPHAAEPPTWHHRGLRSHTL
jgi:hypothetical protein